MNDEHLIAVKDRAAAELLKLPGVRAVGLGGRERGGQRSGEAVIKVFVDRKRPPEALTPGETLPPAFEGVGVDVSSLTFEGVRAPMPPGLPADPPGSPATREQDMDGELRDDPLTGGGRLQVQLGGGVQYGTAGCFLNVVPPPPAQVDVNAGYLLTAYHVLITDTEDPVVNQTRVGHPTNFDPPTKCTNRIIGTLAGGAHVTNRDSALIKLNAGRVWAPEIFKIGAVQGTYDITVKDLVLEKPFAVQKYGIRTGLTGGYVTAINISAPAPVKHPKPGQPAAILHQNTMMITPNAREGLADDQELHFVQEGDSGAALVTNNPGNRNKVVGICIISFPDVQDALTFVGRAQPIADILGRFADPTNDDIQLQVATAAQEGEKRTMPGTAVRAPRRIDDALTGVVPDYVDTLVRVGVDLESVEAGRRLRSLWAEHHAELLDLVDHRRRVTVAWHRGGGPALLHTFLRMAADPDHRMPATINGAPPMDRIADLHAVFHANASPELRRALDRALDAVPDPANLTYDQLMAAIAAR